MPATAPGGSGTGQTLTITQMYALARKAGLEAPNAIVAAAIAMAESSGRAAATSANPDGGTNVGLWQLDTRGAGSGYSVAQLMDPATNAKAMAKASGNGKSWSSWATYNSGAFEKYMQPASAASGAESAGGSSWIGDTLRGIETAGKDIGSVIGAAAGQLLRLPQQVLGFFSALEAPVRGLLWIVNPSNWARVIAGIFGFLLLSAGLITLMKAA